MANRRKASRQALRIGPVLAVAAVTGYLLGGCGGGDLSGVTGFSGVTELPTGTRPSLTVPTLPTRTETVPEATTEAPTTSPEPTTTSEPTTTVTETETTATEPTTPTTVPTDTGAGEPPSDNNGFWAWLTLALAAAGGETTTSESPPTNADTGPTETVAPEATSSETGTPWGWIALGLGLALAALVVGLVVWRRRRASTASWSSQLDDLARRSLVAMDDVVREGSVVTGQVEGLAAEARSLQGRAPDDPSRTFAARLRERLDELAGALEADRALRLSSPPPSADQLSYSAALIREHMEQLHQLLTPPPADDSRN